MPPTASINLKQRVFSPSLTKLVVNSPCLSLTNQTNMYVQGGRQNFDSCLIARTKEHEYENRSGSDNMDGGSSDDQDGDKPPSKKRYHRHTPQQIQELEAIFEECQHPDKKQRMELSKKLNLEGMQIKSWFQNRRAQIKTQLERHENFILKQENDKLRSENMSLRDALKNPVCSNCGGPAMLGYVSLAQKLENARLKDELDRLCALAGKFLGWN